MSTQFKTRAFSVRTFYIRATVDGVEHDFETDFGPSDYHEPLVHIHDNHAVVAYLVHDDDPTSPMENDCQGRLITRVRRGNVGIADDESAMFGKLMLDGYGAPDRYADVRLNGITLSLEAHAERVMAERVLSNYEEFMLWADEHGEIETLPELEQIGYIHEADFPAWAARDEVREAVYEDIEGSQTPAVENELLRIYTENWKQIVGPYVLPVSYGSERGSTSISVGTWDGDPDDLPSAIWVADKNVMDNLPAPVAPDAPDFDERIKAYAESVLSEYALWCEGNVWGCVCHQYTRAEGGVWERDPEHVGDSCWGFIGSDYAEKSLLDEFFNPAVRSIP